MKRWQIYLTATWTSHWTWRQSPPSLTTPTGCDLDGDLGFGQHLHLRQRLRFLEKQRQFFGQAILMLVFTEDEHFDQLGRSRL